MFPLGSDYPVRGRTPVTWTVIVLCGGIVLLQLLQQPPFSGTTLLRFGAIPALVAFDLVPWKSDSPHTLLTMVTSMFVHAGVLHVVGNMLFFHCFSSRSNRSWVRGATGCSTSSAASLASWAMR